MKIFSVAMKFVTVFTLVLASTLIAAPVVHAQDSAGLPTKNVTITLSNSPVRSALDALFKNAGLNYTIDPGITGDVTVNLKDVPFDVALRAILRSSTPPLQYRVENGIYQIMQPAAATSTVSANPNSQPTQTASGAGAAASGTETKQAVVIYLTYASGALLNAVIGPVSIINPALTTPGSGNGQNGTSSGQSGTNQSYGGGSSGGFGGGGFGGNTTIGGGGSTTTGFSSSF